jgi:hypothetical protein
VEVMAVAGMAEAALALVVEMMDTEMEVAVAGGMEVAMVRVAMVPARKVMSVEAALEVMAVRGREVAAASTAVS